MSKSEDIQSRGEDIQSKGEDIQSKGEDIQSRGEDIQSKGEDIQSKGEDIQSKGEDIQYHVILDNYCIHKNNGEWLEKHKNVHFHYTPTSASRLNQVEIWFNIMSRKVLRGASFESVDCLTSTIKKYIAAYNENARPFVWRKREVRGSQIRDNIANLCK
ncbi:hypothetical protein FACS1894152_6040 [Bacilli bacterium]|nr:hypothetical protein FACS1894152_6040 [Bacilli bacterium]